MKTFKEKFWELFKEEQETKGLQSCSFTHMSQFNSMVKDDQKVTTPTEDEVYQDLYYILKNFNTDKFKVLVSASPRESDDV